MTSHWTDQAACAATPDVTLTDYFPPRGRPDAATRAKAVCATCPVEARCLDEHLFEEFGVWGGTTPRERVELRRPRNPALDADHQCPHCPWRSTSRAGLRRHAQRRHGTTITPLADPVRDDAAAPREDVAARSCPHCRRISKNRHALIQHVRQVHGVTITGRRNRLRGAA